MATVTNERYPVGGSLAPDEWLWWTIGPWSAAFDGTFHVDAHPYFGLGSQYPQGISVIWTQAALGNHGEHYLNVIVKNTYSTPIVGYTIWVTVAEGIGCGANFRVD